MTVRIAICAASLLAAAALHAAPAAQAIPPDETRIAAIAAALPEKPGGNECFDRLDREVDFPKAEKLLGSPVPDVPDALYLEFRQNGNRTHYQEAYIDRRMGGFRTLVTAERVEGKGCFLPKVVEYMEAMAGQRSWVLPAHDRALGNFYGTNLTIDLVSSHLALDLANALDSFRGCLPERTVRRVTDEIERRVFALYRADWASPKPKHWWFYGMNNWNAVCHGGVVRAALQIEPDRMDRARFVEAAMRGQDSFLKGGFEDDGYCSEGMSYWEYGFGNYIDMGLAIRRATKGRFDLFAEGGARARAAAAYPFAFQLQKDISPHFADGGGNPSTHRRRQCREIWPGLGGDASLPPRSVFPSAQVFISRVDGARPFSLAIKGGSNAERHNHNDVGTWTLMLDGVELAGDPGGEVYTARTFSARRYESDVLNSYGHPVPRIDGQLQPEGGRFRAKVLKTDFTDAKDTVVLDLSGAYAVKGIRCLVRTSVFDRAARSFTVSDEAEFDRPMAFDVPIITYCAVERGATPGEFTLKGARGVAASVAVSASGGEWELQEKIIENPGRPAPRRIAAAFTRPVAKAAVAFTIKEK